MAKRAIPTEPDDRGNSGNEKNTEQQVIDTLEENTQAMKELVGALTSITNSQMENLGGQTGLPTVRAASVRRKGTRGGMLGFAADLFNEVADYTTPSADLAAYQYSVGRATRPNPITTFGMIAGGAVQRAAQTVKDGKQVVTPGYAMAPSGDKYIYNRKTGRIHDPETGDMVGNPGLHEIMQIATRNNYSEDQINDMLQGNADISRLRDLVMESGSDRAVQEFYKMEASGFRGQAASMGRTIESYSRKADVIARAGQLAVKGLDKLYAPAGMAAGLGYGYERIGGYPSPFSAGAVEMVRQQALARMQTLRPGLSGPQVAEMQSTIEGMGYRQAGQGDVYRGLMDAMGQITQGTGGRLATSAQADVFQMALRSGQPTGRGASDFQELVKLLRDDLPAAANASRMSLNQLHGSLMKTVEQVQQNPFNTLTPLQNYQRTLTAYGSGAQPQIAGLMAGQNQLLDITAATMSGQSLARLQYSPFAAAERQGAIQNIVQRMFPGVGSRADLLRLQRDDPDTFARRMMQLQMYGMDEQALFGYFNQNNRNVQAASILGGLSQFEEVTKGKVVTGKKSELLNAATFGIFGDQGIASAIGDKQVVGESVIGPGGFEGDPNRRGSARELYTRNQKYIEEAMRNMSSGERSSFNERLQQVLQSNGSATDLQSLFKETQGKISKKEAGEQSAGRNVKVTISLDPNTEAYRNLNINYQNQAYKSLVINGNNAATQPGSLSEAYVNGGSTY